MTTLTKHQFKICEAVALGLTHYYMGPRDKREVTASERTEALATIPDLPEGRNQETDFVPCRTPYVRHADTRQRRGPVHCEQAARTHEDHDNADLR